MSDHAELSDYVVKIHEELMQAIARIALLEDRLHDHEQTVPHAESQA